MWVFASAVFQTMLLLSSAGRANESVWAVERSLLQLRASRVSTSLLEESEDSTRPYYVSPSGNDARGDGTRSSPYRTLFGVLRRHRDSLMEQGGKIFLRGGLHRWAFGEGRIEDTKFSGKGLLIASDPMDSYPAVLSGAVEIEGASWRKRSRGQWNPEAAQEGTHVWCSPLPVKMENGLLEDGVRALVWVDYGSGLQLARQAQSPDIDHEIDDIDWPFTPLMADMVVPQNRHAFSDNFLRATLPVELSAPPWCKHVCTFDCQGITGGFGCPRMRNLPECGLNTAWLHDEERFGDASKNFTGGFLDIGLCSSKSILKYMPIIAHDRKRGRVQFDYSRYACDPDKPARRTDMWTGDNSCWRETFQPMGVDEPRYRIYSQAVLDHSNEWFIMPHETTAIPEVCMRLRSNPATSKGPSVHVRVNGPALDFLGSENIRVAGVHFFATEMRNIVNMRTGFGRDNVFTQASMLYPGKVFLGPATLLDSEVRFGRGISFSGWMGSSHNPAPCRMENTLLEYSWSGVELWDCAGGTVALNTIRKIQNGHGMQVEFHRDRGAAVEEYIAKEVMNISFNRIHDVGFGEVSQGSGFHTRNGAYRGMQYHNNWIYQMPSHIATQLDAGENGGDLFQNVFWRTAKGLVAKGGVREGNRIVHNTGFHNRECDFSILELDEEGRRCNDKSEVFNNAGNDWRDSGSADCGKPACASPCASGNNSVHFGTCTHTWQRVQDMLRDVSVYDFRPLSDASITGAANEIFVNFGAGRGVEQTLGAYEANGTHYSIPGRVVTRSSSPIPPHGFPSALETQDLMWNRGRDAVAHDVFLGSSYCAVLRAERRDRSLLLGRFKWPRNIASNSLLEMGTTYYWRVDAVVEDRIIKGEVWCFRVTETGAITLDSPWNLVTGTDKCASLRPNSCLGVSKEKSTPVPGTIPIKRRKSCSAMIQRKKCVHGEVNVFPLKVLTSDACIDLCSSYSWSEQACCTWRIDGLCRIHTGRFSSDEASGEWFGADCVGALPTTTTTTTGYQARPLCSSMQSKRICVDGQIEILGKAPSAKACQSLCEKITRPSSNCCVWYKITETCRLHSGDFNISSKDHFYAADCSEDAPQVNS